MDSAFVDALNGKPNSKHPYVLFQNLNGQHVFVSIKQMFYHCHKINIVLIFFIVTIDPPRKVVEPSRRIASTKPTSFRKVYNNYLTGLNRMIRLLFDHSSSQFCHGR